MVKRKASPKLSEAQERALVLALSYERNTTFRILSWVPPGAYRQFVRQPTFGSLCRLGLFQFVKTDWNGFSFYSFTESGKKRALEVAQEAGWGWNDGAWNTDKPTGLRGR